MEMQLFVHKGRNVVVKRADEGDKMLVSYVGVAENVAGAKRRGRHPDYTKGAVKTSDLVAFESPSADWMERAVMALEAPAEEAVFSAPEAAGDTSESDGN